MQRVCPARKSTTRFAPPSTIKAGISNLLPWACPMAAKLRRTAPDRSMHFIDSNLRRICAVAGVIGIAAIVSLMGLTVVTVVLRALRISFPGTYSLSELLLIPAVSISVAYAAFYNEHTRAEIFVNMISNERLRNFIHGLML